MEKNLFNFTDFNKCFTDLSIDIYTILDKLDLYFGLDKTRDIHKTWLDFRVCLMTFIADNRGV